MKEKKKKERSLFHLMEVFPSSKQDAVVVGKTLLQEIIWRQGISGKLSSDTEAAFATTSFKKVIR